MQEILFRGFHPDENGNEKVFVNGEWIKGTWIYGYPYPAVGLDKGKWLITQINIDFQGSHTYFVIPETIGQYTRLADKNDKRIFEGDIVKHYTDCPLKEYSVDMGRIFWYQPTQRYLRTSSTFPNDCPGLFENDKYEVIGNIYDNPELPK